MAQTTIAKSKRTRKPKHQEQEAVPCLVPTPPTDLVVEDDEPLESDWHVQQIHLFTDLIHQLWNPKTDFFAGANMFVYYSETQAEAIKKKRTAYKGPDFFVVKDVDGTKPRECWVAWDEEGRYPDVIFELSSPSTVKKDKEENLVLYSRTFGTLEYFIYDPYRGELLGYRLTARKDYEPIVPDERGWLWSEQLEVWVGLWEGVYRNRRRVWVRWWTVDGELVPTPFEAERARAEAERQRAEAEQARAEKLAQRLRELGYDPDTV